MPPQPFIKNWILTLTWRLQVLQFQNIEEGNTIGKEEIYNTLVNSQGAMEAQKKMQEDIRWAGTGLPYLLLHFYCYFYVFYHHLEPH